MFDLAMTFMVQFINMLPSLIPFILIINLCASLLWGGKNE